jgi:cytochrome c oxidase subunit 2
MLHVVRNRGYDAIREQFGSSRRACSKGLAEVKTIKVLPLALLGTAVGIVISLVLIFTRTLPVQASAEADDIDNLYIFFLAFSGIIFGIVVLFLLVSIYRFRARPNDEREGENVHGITWLEVVWTVIPFVIVVLCAIGGLMVLRSGDVEAQARTSGQQIHVLGYQFGWKYSYLNQGIDLKDQQTLVLPVNEPVIFELESSDVIHSFWVPAWRMQMNATPGQINEVSATPTKIGSFEIICAYLCGVGHTNMNSALPGSIIPKVQVVSKSDFDAWVSKQKAEAAKAAESTSAQMTTGSAG